MSATEKRRHMEVKGKRTMHADAAGHTKAVKWTLVKMSFVKMWQFLTCTAPCLAKKKQHSPHQQICTQTDIMASPLHLNMLCELKVQTGHYAVVSHMLRKCCESCQCVKQGKVVTAPAFSLLLHPLFKGHILFDLADLLWGLMTHLSHHYNYGSSKLTIYQHHRTIQ